MSVENALKKIARLAGLKLSLAEEKDYAAQIENVLDHFRVLSEVQTDSIEPLLSPVENSGFLREDIEKKSVSVEELIDLAPESQGHLYRVPPVV